jgi:hypothetical protein
VRGQEIHGTWPQEYWPLSSGLGVSRCVNLYDTRLGRDGAITVLE